MLLALLLCQSAFADAAADWYPSNNSTSYNVQVSAPDGGCNLRYGPGVHYDRIINYMIPNGTILYITREAQASNGNYWGYTQYNGYYGWVALSQCSVWYGSTANSSSGTTYSSGSPTHACYDVQVSAYDGNLNIRYGAGTSNDRLTTNPIPNGTRLHIFYEEMASNGNYWGFTSYNNMNGWVALTQCTRLSGTPSYYTGYSVTVTSYDGTLNLRNGAGTEYSRVMNYAIPNGTTLWISAEQKASNGNYWGLTTYDGKTGWVALTQCTPIAEYVNKSVSSSGGKSYNSQEVLTSRTMTASAAAASLNNGLIIKLAVLMAAVLLCAGLAGMILHKKHS